MTLSWRELDELCGNAIPSNSTPTYWKAKSTGNRSEPED